MNTVSVCEKLSVDELADKAYADGLNKLTNPITNPIVSIIILTWNGLALTKDCYESIKLVTKAPHEIIFVDNGSVDGTKEWLLNLRDSNSNIKCAFEPNNGFAKACNIGISLASSDYVVLLNNDTLVCEGWVESMIHYLNQLNNCVIMASTTNSVGNFYQFFTCLECVKPTAIRPSTNEVNFVCVMIKKEFWNEIKLDENYISGVEDIDYCWEAKKRGKEVWVCLNSFVYHFGSKTNLQEFGEKLMDDNLKKGWAYFAKKWGEEGVKRAGAYLNDL